MRGWMKSPASIMGPSTVQAMGLYPAGARLDGTRHCEFTLGRATGIPNHLPLLGLGTPSL